MRKIKIIVGPIVFVVFCSVIGFSFKLHYDVIALLLPAVEHRQEDSTKKLRREHKADVAEIKKAVRSAESSSQKSENASLEVAVNFKQFMDYQRKKDAEIPDYIEIY